MEFSKIALLVIDMQENYIGQNSKYGYDAKQLIENINKRIIEAKKNNDMIIYVKNRGKKNKTYISEFVTGLFILSNFIVEKEKPSVFTNPVLNDLLKKNKISQIETIGIDGNCCVAFSAIDGARLGFSVIFPLKYIGMRNSRIFLKTKEKLLKENIQIIEKFVSPHQGSSPLMPIGISGEGRDIYYK